MGVRFLLTNRGSIWYYYYIFKILGEKLMKRKILLFAMLICVLACLFALSVSAETVISEENIDESGDIVADVIYQVKDYQFYFSVDITYDDINGNNKEGKFYYITGTGLYGNKLELLGVYVPYDFDFNQMIYLFDKADYTNDGAYGYSEYLRGSNGGQNAMHWHSYKSFDEETATFSEATVDIKTSITAISYSKYMSYLGHYFIPKASSLKTVTYNGKPAVEGTIFISPSVTEVMSNTFGGEGNNSGNKTSETPQYKRIVFEASTSSMTLQQYTFCRGVVEEIVFLARSYSFRNDSIAYQWKEGTNTPCLKNIVVQAGAQIATGKIDLNVGNYDIIFIGTESEYATQSSEGKFTSLSNATGNVTYETICYVYGHTDSNDHDCTTTDYCAVEGCGEVMRQGNEAHNENGVAEFADYYSVITETITCNNEGCNHKAVNTLAPIFKFNGYSIKETEKNAICAGFSINSYAINRYCKGLSFGVIGTAFEEGETKGQIFDENGNVLSSVGNVIHARLDANCNKVDLKLVSDAWAYYGSLELVMALYSYDENGIQYINGANDAHTTYEIITYNAILNQN